MSTTDREMVVSIDNVSRQFRQQDALCNVSLQIPRGGVYGLLGINGAGKTTLIRHILGLFRAASGSVRVFGVDPAEQPEVALARIGYLSEEDQLPGWMKVGQLSKFYKAFYPDWDIEYERELMDMFHLDPTKRLNELSKGQRARAGLLIALAHRPDLLVLDEPSSGLDPIVRGDILEAIIRTIADEGRTVLFSSHLLDEVERVADRVAVINSGRVIYNDELDALKERFRRISLGWSEPHSEPPEVGNAYGWQGAGTAWSAIFDLSGSEPSAIAQACGAQLHDVTPVSLHEIFVATLGNRGDDMGDQPRRSADEPNPVVTS